MPVSSVALSLISVLLAPTTDPDSLHAPARLQLTVATIHAAALTAPREAADSLDSPYLLVSRVGPGRTTATGRLPLDAHFAIRADQALGAEPLLTLELAPGDSVQLLLSLLENPEVRLADEGHLAEASAAVLAQPGDRRGAELSTRVAPALPRGTQWLGSLTVLLTNEAGTLRWRALDCAVTCGVLDAPEAAEIVLSAGAGGGRGGGAHRGGGHLPCQSSGAAGDLSAGAGPCHRAKVAAGRAGRGDCRDRPSCVVGAWNVH
ncbi:MAG: hypothetical protein IPK12_24055 [Gemmatimonadetes bacterium]|nr:hypothetical protein [Gemmatimonadota bacterium]